MYSAFSLSSFHALSKALKALSMLSSLRWRFPARKCSRPSDILHSLPFVYDSEPLEGQEFIGGCHVLRLSYHYRSEAPCCHDLRAGLYLRHHPLYYAVNEAYEAVEHARRYRLDRIAAYEPLRLLRLHPRQ